MLFRNDRIRNDRFKMVGREIYFISNFRFPLSLFCDNGVTWSTEYRFIKVSRGVNNSRRQWIMQTFSVCSVIVLARVISPASDQPWLTGATHSSCQHELNESLWIDHAAEAMHAGWLRESMLRHGRAIAYSTGATVTGFRGAGRRVTLTEMLQEVEIRWFIYSGAEN